MERSLRAITCIYTLIIESRLWNCRHKSWLFAYPRPGEGWRLEGSKLEDGGEIPTAFLVGGSKIFRFRLAYMKMYVWLPRQKLQLSFRPTFVFIFLIRNARM